jgi:hypothetical protein
VTRAKKPKRRKSAWEIAVKVYDRISYADNPEKYHEDYIGLMILAILEDRRERRKAKR